MAGICKGRLRSREKGHKDDKENIHRDVFSGTQSPKKVQELFDAVWRDSEKTDEASVALSEANLTTLLRHFRRTNFRRELSTWKKGYRAQCWECLKIFCGKKPSGGLPHLVPPCHPIASCKDRERSCLGKFIVRGAFLVTASTLSSLFSVMGEAEQSVVMELKAKYDIFIVRAVGTTRSYMGRSKALYEACEIEDMELFIKSHGKDGLKSTAIRVRRTLKICPLCEVKISVNEGSANHMKKHKRPQIASFMQGNARFVKEENVPFDRSFAFLIFLNMCGFVCLNNNEVQQLEPTV